MDLRRIDDPRFILIRRSGGDVAASDRKVELAFAFLGDGQLTTCLAELLGLEGCTKSEAIDLIEDRAEYLNGLSIVIKNINSSLSIFDIAPLLEEIQLVAYVVMRKGYFARFILEIE